jgi:hypothetical protein
LIASVFDALGVELVPHVCGGGTLAAANPVDTGGAGGKRLVLLVGQKKAVHHRTASGAVPGDWPRPDPAANSR